MGHSFDLTKEHTRTLLKWLNKARKCGFGYDPTENKNNVITIQELKNELTKREHIPNKQEAKKIRQQKAKDVQ